VAHHHRRSTLWKRGLGEHMTKTPLAGLVLASFALILFTLSCAAMSEARAADPVFCRQYSQASLNQVRGALANPRCAAALQGSRWSTDFSTHYQWCLGVSDADAGVERDARTNISAAAGEARANKRGGR
jgi:hypothetical protein